MKKLHHLSVLLITLGVLTACQKAENDCVPTKSEPRSEQIIAGNLGVPSGTELSNIKSRVKIESFEAFSSNPMTGKDAIKVVASYGMGGSEYGTLNVGILDINGKIVSRAYKIIKQGEGKFTLYIPYTAQKGEKKTLLAGVLWDQFETSPYFDKKDVVF